MNKIKNKYDASVILASILIAIIPILSPYALFGISIVWVIGGFYIFYILAIVTKGKLRIDKKIASYFSFPFIIFIISINGFFVLRNVTNLFHQLLGLIIETVIIYYLWSNSDYHLVLKICNIIGYICGVYALLQVIMLLSGNEVPMGKIEFLQLISGQSWIPETWGYRFNSLFSEPSYYAIYLLPLLAANFIDMNYINVVIFSISIILSSSTLGIVGMILVIAWQVLTLLLKGNYNSIIKILVFVFLTSGILAYIVMSIDSLNEMFIRTIDKFYSIGSINNNIRMTGYIDYYSEYGLKEMLFGVGISQFQNYFVEQGVSLYNYSNSLVMMLLQYGIIGSIFSIVYYAYLWMESQKRKSMLFFVLLIMIMAVDYVTFSYRYYYLLYFVLFFVQSSDRKHLALSSKRLAHLYQL